MKKRLLATMLALCMVITMLPVTAMADEGTEQDPAPSEDTVQVDSVDELESAIKEENADKTIEITKGLTITEEITVNQPVTITSVEGVTITVRNDGTTFVLSNGATLDGLSLVMSERNTVQADIVNMQDGTTVTGCKFTGQFDGGNEVSRGIVSVSGEITITDNTFQNLRQPAYIDDGNSGTISGNHVDGTRGWVICSNSDMEISGNTFGENVVDIAIIQNPNVTDNKYAGKTAELSQKNGNASV